MDATTRSEISRRIKLSESCRLYKYRDSVRDEAHPIGVITAAWGLNCERDDVRAIVEKVGVDWGHFSAAAIAKDSEPENAVAACLLQAQADAVFEIALAPVLVQARASLDAGVFDVLTPARQFVIVDLCYNLGEAGWLAFAETRQLISQGQLLKNQGRLVQAHGMFVTARQHLTASPWFGQVGDRARRDVAMLVSGEWVDANGDGSDAAA